MVFYCDFHTFELVVPANPLLWQCPVRSLPFVPFHCSRCKCWPPVIVAPLLLRIWSPVVYTPMPCVSEKNVLFAPCFVNFTCTSRFWIVVYYLRFYVETLLSQIDGHVVYIPLLFTFFCLM